MEFVIPEVHPCCHIRIYRYTLYNAISIEIANDEIVASTGKSMQESNLGGIQINQNILCVLALVCTGVSACLFVLWVARVCAFLVAATIELCVIS